MSSAEALTIDPADLPEPPSEDRAELDRQLAKLDRLGDLGLEIAEALADQAKGGRMIVEGDIALAYDRVARAVRMTVMLHSRLMQDLRRARDEAAAGPAPARGEQAKARKDQVARVVRRVAEGHEALDPFQVSWCAREASERLEHDDIYGPVMTLPVSELVQAICHDLGLTPDWARLADEAWAIEEMDGEDVGYPLQAVIEAEAAEEAAATEPPDEGEAAGEPPPRALRAIPTFHEHLQALARDPAVLAAAGRPSG